VRWFTYATLDQRKAAFAIMAETYLANRILYFQEPVGLGTIYPATGSRSHLLPAVVLLMREQPKCALNLMYVSFVLCTFG
jgi:hypothetical protein